MTSPTPRCMEPVETCMAPIVDGTNYCRRHAEAPATTGVLPAICGALGCVNGAMHDSDLCGHHHGLRLLSQRTAAATPPAEYAELQRVLEAAHAQASRGKGLERHGSVGEKFEDQQIVQLGEWMGNGGSTHFAIGQACKKSLESTRLTPERAVAELLGAINYLAAAVLVVERAAGGRIAGKP